MRVISINGRFLSQSITGVQRYAIELVNALDNLINSGEIEPRRVSFIMLAPKGVKNTLNLKHIPVRPIGFFSGHLWEQIELPFYTRGTLLVNLCNTAPLLKWNQVVTVHDASVFAIPQVYSFRFRSWYKVLLTGLVKIARRIITDSSFSKNELIRYCHINESKIQVIALGKEHILSIPSDKVFLQNHGLNNKPFILTVSSMNISKNLHSVVSAMELLGNIDFDIVIAGGVNPKVFSRSQPLPGIVKYIGYVSDSELRTLYENATFLVYPSFYEGFGLPPLEAMACGCPVLISNTASLPEVFGDAALYCDPHNPEDIAEKIALLMKDATLRDELRRRGLEHAKQFTWQRCAQETFAVIEEMLR